MQYWTQRDWLEPLYLKFNFNSIEINFKLDFIFTLSYPITNLNDNSLMALNFSKFVIVTCNLYSEIEMWLSGKYIKNNKE